jgi:imidazole glycerol-phosphate synthase subunit HisH
VQRFADREGLPVPHMGWNQLALSHLSPLFEEIENGDYVYFVHSYAAPLGAHTIASSDYGTPFTAVVQRGNVYGAQFHPERSARVGSLLLRNFLRLS